MFLLVRTEELAETISFVLRILEGFFEMCNFVV